MDASKISGLPTCGAGQVLSYSGGAFACVTPAAASNQVGACDATLLIGGKTAKQCCDAGGNVVSGGSSTFLCKVSGSTCPPGWSRYLNWSTTQGSSGAYCTNWGICGGEGYMCCGTGYCSVGGHAFSNTAQETDAHCGSSSITEVGCQ